MKQNRDKLVRKIIKDLEDIINKLNPINCYVWDYDQFVDKHVYTRKEGEKEYRIEIIEGYNGALGILLRALGDTPCLESNL